MKISKSSGKYRILESGSVFTYSGTDDVTFHIKMDNKFKFQVILKFQETESGAQKIYFDTDGESNRITMTCINFNHPLGTGTKKPIELATVNKKKVFINFCIYARGDEIPRKITYTFYIEQ